MTEARRTLVEALFAFAVATAVASILFHFDSVPFVHQYLYVLVAATFIALPSYLLRDKGGIERHGFVLEPVADGLRIFAIFSVIVFPLFVVGFVAYYRAICAGAPSLAGGACFRVAHPVFHWPKEVWSFAAAQLVVVALPEELFFRGYLQGRLEEIWPPTRKLFGAPVGKAWLVAAALFGLGHYLVTFEPGMLTRAFPGLAFGWMFARTRSIFAGTLFHAACNFVMEVMVGSYLR